MPYSFLEKDVYNDERRSAGTIKCSPYGAKRNTSFRATPLCQGRVPFWGEKPKKQPKAFDHEPQRHQRQASAVPCQQGALGANNTRGSLREDIGKIYDLEISNRF